MAEAVFNDEIKKMGLQNNWEADSAGLIDYHAGSDPNYRTMNVLAKNGINGYKHKARVIRESDYHTFDWIFGMDSYNMQELYSRQPENSKAKVELLGKYDPNGEIIIRDPYYDEGDSGFEKAYEQCRRSIQGFLKIHN